MQSAPDRLATELATVTGPLCGHTCDHQTHLTCLRADGHHGAQLMTDMHIGRDSRDPDNPVVVVFGDQCCT
jgi:hypothetical protein